MTDLKDLAYLGFELATYGVITVAGWIYDALTWIGATP